MDGKWLLNERLMCGKWMVDVDGVNEWLNMVSTGSFPNENRL